MSLIPAPAAPALTPEQIAAEAVAASLRTLAHGAKNLAGCIAMTRASGAQAIYAQGITHANAVFAALGEAGVKLVQADLLQRQLLDLNSPGSGASPLPPGIDIIPLDEQGNPTADLTAAVRISVVAV